jgi:hypothetical protein
MRGILLKWVILTELLMFTIQLAAQTDSAQKQFWPEADIYYRINQRFRVFGQFSGTKSNSTYTDGTAGLYLDFFAKPWLRDKRNDTEISDSSSGYYWWFRTGYSYSNSAPGDKKKLINIIETETNNIFQLPADIILQTRNRLDWRWVNNDFQPVYRPRVKFIRNLKTEYLTFNVYIWSEYFFYLNEHDQDRLRLTIGSQIKVLKNMDIELYYLHQFPNKQSVAPIDAIGFMLDLYFKSKHYNYK